MINRAVPDDRSLPDFGDQFVTADDFAPVAGQVHQYIHNPLLYAIVAWIVLQVADIVLPALTVPDWGISLVLTLLVLGFPVALVLGWVYQVTPEGIRMDRLYRAGRTASTSGPALETSA